MKRALAAGYTALAVTVDTPVLGRREADMRNRFKLPSHLTMGNFASAGGAHASGTKDGGNDSVSLLYSTLAHLYHLVCYPRNQVYSLCYVLIGCCCCVGVGMAVAGFLGVTLFSRLVVVRSVLAVWLFVGRL